ncbi:MAG: hypothetical protein M0C28_37070 [Candidatus Moduliflexus flocculans]|nr:hypothetical protein [Candidatus Moduliflexus flocculans]
MVLDDFTRRNLELTGSLLDGGRRGSLLGVLDRTVTAMGARQLRQWIGQPLVELDARSAAATTRSANWRSRACCAATCVRQARRGLRPRAAQCAASPWPPATPRTWWP